MSGTGAKGRRQTQSEASNLNSLPVVQTNTEGYQAMAESKKKKKKKAAKKKDS